MKNNTIEEAVIQVLKKGINGMTSKEITDKILEQKLYQFNSKNPASIVGSAIRKSCVGIDINASKPHETRSFELMDQGKYKLRKLS